MRLPQTDYENDDENELSSPTGTGTRTDNCSKPLHLVPVGFALRIHSAEEHGHSFVSFRMGGIRLDFCVVPDQSPDCVVDAEKNSSAHACKHGTTEDSAFRIGRR